MNHLSQAATLTAIRSAEETLDALRLINVQRPDSRFDELEDSAPLAQAILDRAEGRLASKACGIWREINDEMTHRHGPTERDTIRVSWGRLARAAARRQSMHRAVTVAGTTPNLSFAKNQPMVEALYANGGIGARLGVSYINAGRSTVGIPAMTGVSTAYPLTSESTNTTTSTHTLTAVALSGKTFGVNTSVSRLLLLQSDAAAIIEHDQAQVAARVIDNQPVYGSGSGGNVQGLIGTGGVSTFTGTSASLAALQGVVGGIGDAVGSTFGFMTTKAVATVLRGRAELSGGTTPLWVGNIVAGKLIDFPAYSTSNATAGALVAGEWRYLAVAIWGGGIEIGVNPYTKADFQTGMVQIQTFVTVDSAPVFPGAFQYATSVT